MLTFESSHDAWNRRVEPGAERFVDEIDDADDWVIVRVDADPDLVGGPVREPSARSLSLVIRRGGFLAVEARRVPPKELGRFTLARADGAPFPCMSEAYCVAEVAIEPGLVLGPLEPGAVTWRVRLGGKDFGTVQADVHAGEQRPLVLPAPLPEGLGTTRAGARP